MSDNSLRTRIKEITDSADSALADAVEKELLHAEILGLMKKHGMLETLTFAGGTALRICYGSPRLSEDLDFATSQAYQPELLREFADHARSYFSSLDIAVTVTEPKILRAGSFNRNNFDHINIDRWMVKFELAPNRPDIPLTRIKLEIAAVPSYTREPIKLISHYPSVAPAADIAIPVESLSEIMADKLISLPASDKKIRHRDIWDLTWMAEKGIKPDMELIERKIIDYNIQDYDKKLDARINSLPEILESQEFLIELQRFLPESVMNEKLIGADNHKRIIDTVGRLLSEVHQSLDKSRVEPFELSSEGLERAKAIPLISGGSHPRTVFRDLAKDALQAHNGDATLVDWRAVERNTIVKAIGELGYQPNEVISTIKQHSPACVSPKAQEKLTHEVKALAPDLKAQFKKSQNQAPNKDRSR